MQSEIVAVRNDGTGLEKALEMTENYAAELKLDNKMKMRLRILAEELFGMVRAITKDFTAEYSISDESGVIRMQLETETAMDIEKKENLIAVSSTHKNEAAKGVMGKIRDIFESVMFTPAGADSLQIAQLQASSMMMGTYAGAVSADFLWSLDRYRFDVKEALNKEESSEEWDELEKSIIANLANDVRVWVRGNKARLSIEVDTMMPVGNR